MLTEKQVLELFEDEVRPLIVQRCGEGDIPALREGFNNWTDGLCKDGEISLELYESIEGPD
jgi:hypothetical protein